MMIMLRVTEVHHRAMFEDYAMKLFNIHHLPMMAEWSDFTDHGTDFLLKQRKSSITACIRKDMSTAETIASRFFLLHILFSSEKSDL